MKGCLVLDAESAKKWSEIKGLYPYVELRLDMMEWTDKELVNIFNSDTYSISTYRKKNEENALESYSRAISLGTNCIDIGEDIMGDERTLLLEKARSNGTDIILSYHNFHKAEDISLLEKRIKMYQDEEVKWVKIAIKITTKSEALDLMNLYSTYHDIIIFGLGEWAKFTRVASYYLGAPYVYVSHDYSLAEGILTPEELANYPD